MKQLTDRLKSFSELDTAGGIVLVIATVLALLFANSPLVSLYDLWVDLPVEVRVGPLEIAKPLLLWINDGLMAIFFLAVGLELKRELLEGELTNPDSVKMPLVGAFGGMVVPAAIYASLNWQDPETLRGWAIPSATDIAFALGFLSLLGDRVPTSLKVFLVSLAMFDDFGAIIIIAIFYSHEIFIGGLIVAVASMAALWFMNKRHVMTFTPYMVVGTILWVALLKSGVHATLAGVILAAFIPLRNPVDPTHSPLMRLEHDLHKTVTFFILPVFAFANAGVSFSGMGLDSFIHSVPVGIAAGLFFGKQIGVFGCCWIGVKMGWFKLPPGINWQSLYGVSLLCGVGFTMSMFIGTLSFIHASDTLLFDERMGIISGSLLSAIVGYLVLRNALSNDEVSDDCNESDSDDIAQQRQLS